MRKELTYEEALHRAAALCTRSEKCTGDIRTKLLTWGISESDAEKIILYLKKERFLDDTRFCSFFVKDKARFNKWGKVKIGFALRAKKIDEQLIQEALSEIDEEHSMETLLALLQSKAKNLKYKDEYDKNGKLIRFALSRGYEFELIQKVIKKIP
jgi:regulatory protein